MKLNHDDIVIRKDVFGDEEKLRVLWMCGADKVRVKSLKNPHRKAFVIPTTRIIRNEGRNNGTTDL